MAPRLPNGTITIGQMTPLQTGSGASLRNGAELNPSSPDAQGFNGHTGPATSQIKFPPYSAALTLTPPYLYNSATESAPDVIVKTISSEDSVCSDNSARVCIHYAETLTLLSSIPNGSYFRPPYVGDVKPPLIPVSAFDDAILSAVPAVATSPSWQDAVDTFLSVHLDHTRNWNQRQGMHGHLNHGQQGRGYEAAVANKTAQGLLKLNEEAHTAEDQQLKRNAALAVAQRGIDLYGIHTSETPCFRGWPASGGFGGGKLGLIVFAANLLGQTDWLTSMNAAMSGDPDARNCFAETGYVRPAMGVGKDVPLFGMRPGGYAGSSCATGSNQNCASGYGGTGAYDGLTDGDLTGSSGSPTAYQECCTHGYMLTEAMAFWLSPTILSNLPSEIDSFLTYIARARTLGVSHGTEFGAYNNPANFDSVGYESGYDSPYVYEMWDTYKACADTFSCEGLAN